MVRTFRRSIDGKEGLTWDFVDVDVNQAWRVRIVGEDGRSVEKRMKRAWVDGGERDSGWKGGSRVTVVEESPYASSAPVR